VPEWDPAAVEIRGGPWASGPFDWPSTPVPAHGVVLVGDAAGYYDPLTGQGIGRALMSAELAAPVVDTALRRGRTDGEALEPYARLFRRRFRPGRRVQRVVEAVVSRSWLRDPVVERLGRAPALLDALLRVTGDARPVRSLLRPRHLASVLRTLP
jgi:flavin-dependent dehydrogenase